MSPWNQAEAHSFVSRPAACRVGKESRIFATSMAHRCPKTLLYQSGERPLGREKRAEMSHVVLPGALSMGKEEETGPQAPGINSMGKRQGGHQGKGGLVP